MKLIKCLKSFLFSIILLAISPCVAFATLTTPQVVDIPGLSGGGGGVIPSLIGAIKWFGVVVAVVMVLIVGIKYLSKGAGAKADVKSNLIPMLIGAIIISSAAAITEAVFNAFAV